MTSLDYPDRSLKHGDKIVLVNGGEILNWAKGWNRHDVGKTFTFDKYETFSCLSVVEKSGADPLLQGRFERDGN